MVIVAKIRITKIPPGQAPDWVRERWVGLELPIVKVSRGVKMGVMGGKAENPRGYAVKTRTAIEILKQNSPEAAKWWEESFFATLAGHLIFKADVCELIE